ncbi:MAG: sugar nucleotide-binding protein [Fodinibius sp.]|nr:sugar nucleotide-binding protein [Fodinibius sp.]
MKILLTGASGQLGQQWQHHTNHRDDIILWPYTSSQLDITNREQVEAELHGRQPDVVVNCAAYTDVDGAEEHPEAATAVNAEAVAHLADVCVDRGCRLVHYSTDYVFAGSQG